LEKNAPRTLTYEEARRFPGLICKAGGVLRKQPEIPPPDVGRCE